MNAETINATLVDDEAEEMEIETCCDCCGPLAGDEEFRCRKCEAVEDATNELDEAECELSSIDDEVGDLECELAELRERLREKRTEQAAARKRLRAAEARLAKLEA